MITSKSLSQRSRANLARITAQMLATSPTSDRAIDLFHEGLILSKDTKEYSRFTHAGAPVILFWQNLLVKNLALGYSIPDIDDAHGAAALWLYEQILGYQVSPTNTIAAYLHSRQSWFKSAYRRSLSEGIYSQGRFTVLGVISKEKEKFITSQRRDPLLKELKELTSVAVRKQTFNKVISNPANAHLTKEQVEREVDARLARTGVTSALADFESLIVDASPLLYLKSGDDDTDTPDIGMIDAPQSRDKHDSFAEEGKYSKILAVSLGDDLWADKLLSARATDTDSAVAGVASDSTLKHFAHENKKDIKYLKTLLSLAKARTIAPHAHWAHLSDDLPKVIRSI